jgi:hypothetical protein
MPTGHQEVPLFLLQTTEQGGATRKSTGAEVLARPGKMGSSAGSCPALLVDQPGHHAADALSAVRKQSLTRSLSVTELGVAGAWSWYTHCQHHRLLSVVLLVGFGRGLQK